MRISERGQITIPKHLRERFGMNHNVEVEITPTEKGLLIQKRKAARTPGGPGRRDPGWMPTVLTAMTTTSEEVRGRKVITSVDTNVLLDVFIRMTPHHSQSVARLAPASLQQGCHHHLRHRVR